MSKKRELSKFYKALSHPARLSIIEKLIIDGTCSCNDFIELLPLAQATISEHLRKLKTTELIYCNKKGVSSEYCINKIQFETFLKMQQHQFRPHLFDPAPVTIIK